MKGIPIGPLAQWGKDLTYYLTPFFCLVNWDMYNPGSACRGTDLPPAEFFTCNDTMVAKGDRDLGISGLVKNPDGTDI